ncbi:hypothetical protein [Terricaulis sp.]|uniref:hypothetical protein n=1 Tax=Terricaulis sp. TaxID=2768686 RepID=UPI0037834E73
MIYLIAGGLILLAITLAWVFARRQPAWKTWKVVLYAALPGPIGMVLISAGWFAVIWNEPRPCTHCDDPGMALFGLLMLGTIGAFMVLIIGALFAWITAQTLRS